MTGVLRPVGLGVGLAAASLAALVAAAVACALVPTVARVWYPLALIGHLAPAGATALLMIGTLTGGRWASAWRPVLAPLASFGTLAAALAFVPVAVSLPAVFPWATDRGAAAPDVAARYLAPGLFVLRGAVALGGWSVLGFVFALGRPSRLVAGLGLVFHGLALSVVGIDWLLSLEPSYVSSNIGALLGIAQIAAALGVLAVVRAPRSGGDLGTLLVATQIGLAYLALMAFVVAWYGDLPETIDWYVRRSETGWLVLVVAAIALGAVLPVGLLLRRSARQGGRGLALAGAAVLAGIAAHQVWLVGPALGARSAIASGLAAVVVFGAALGLARHRRHDDGR